MILRLRLCGGFQPQMAGWERAVLLWEGECVLLTEAFITLAAGASGGGEVLLRGVGLVGILLRVTGLNCGLLKCWLGPFLLSLLAIASTCRIYTTGTQETPTEISTAVPFYNFS